MESVQVLFRGLSAYYGSIGLFGAFERVFLGESFSLRTMCTVAHLYACCRVRSSLWTSLVPSGCALSLPQPSRRLTRRIDAPFGRFLDAGTAGTVNGDIGWLLMEIVSPLSFLLAACTPLSSSGGLGLHVPTIVDLERLAALPTARLVLVGLYFCHYLNRSIIGTW